MFATLTTNKEQAQKNNNLISYLDVFYHVNTELTAVRPFIIIVTR